MCPEEEMRGVYHETMDKDTGHSFAKVDSCQNQRAADAHRFGPNGYTWRRYSHKMLNAGQINRNYYACTERDTFRCTARKLVDKATAITGMSTESATESVLFDGTHNHPPPDASASYNKRIPSNYSMGPRSCRYVSPLKSGITGSGMNGSDVIGRGINGSGSNRSGISRSDNIGCDIYGSGINRSDVSGSGMSGSDISGSVSQSELLLLLAQRNALLDLNQHQAAHIMSTKVPRPSHLRSSSTESFCKYPCKKYPCDECSCCATALKAQCNCPMGSPEMPIRQLHWDGMPEMPSPYGGSFSSLPFHRSVIGNSKEPSAQSSSCHTRVHSALPSLWDADAQQKHRTTGSGIRAAEHGKESPADSPSQSRCHARVLSAVPSLWLPEAQKKHLRTGSGDWMPSHHSPRNGSFDLESAAAEVLQVFQEFLLERGGASMEEPSPKRGRVLQDCKADVSPRPVESSEAPPLSWAEMGQLQKSCLGSVVQHDLQKIDESHNNHLRMQSSAAPETLGGNCKSDSRMRNSAVFHSAVPESLSMTLEKTSSLFTDEAATSTLERKLLSSRPGKGSPFQCHGQWSETLNGSFQEKRPGIPRESSVEAARWNPDSFASSRRHVTSREQIHSHKPTLARQSKLSKAQPALPLSVESRRCESAATTEAHSHVFDSPPLHDGKGANSFPTNTNFSVPILKANEELHGYVPPGTITVKSDHSRDCEDGWSLLPLSSNGEQCQRRSTCMSPSIVSTDEAQIGPIATELLGHVAVDERSTVLSPSYPVKVKPEAGTAPPTLVIDIDDDAENLMQWIKNSPTASTPLGLLHTFDSSASSRLDHDYVLGKLQRALSIADLADEDCEASLSALLGTGGTRNLPN